MQVIMLAAGRGTRLFGDEHDELPKCLLEFGGATLLRRHVEALRTLSGLDALTLVTGYRTDRLEAELEKIGAGSFVRTVFNSRYHEGAVVSLWTARDVLRAGEPVLYMDADVLYHPALLERLLAAPAENCLLFDAHLDDGDDPVMICRRDGRIEEFGKLVAGDFDDTGEWPGFLKLGAATAAQLADALDDAVSKGDPLAPYEPALRTVILGASRRDAPTPFDIVDISDLPWIEIDFPEDLERARGRIAPQLAGS